MITADQLVAHAIGDYVLQSDWMASKKRTSGVAAMIHALTYTLCFVPFVIGPSFPVSRLAVICCSHYLIDRYGLARYVVWAKNFLAPRWLPIYKLTSGFEVLSQTINGHEMPVASTRHVRNYPWDNCQATGYPPDRPPFLAVWLLIVADNVLHVLINGLALL